jgi:hypothetical protein
VENPNPRCRPLLGELAPFVLAAGEVVAEPKVAARHVTYARNLFDALLDRGFTDNQALRVVCACGLGAFNSVLCR